MPHSIDERHLLYRTIEDEIGKVIVGQKELIRRLLLALLIEGHILLEGVPGLAKTLTVLTLAKTLQCQFKRIQFTPDLLPADLIGTTVYNPQQQNFRVQKGPIFTQILVADEINRAPAKVQSALLEVMQEKQVTIAGESFPVLSPFLVLATQNPLEHEGTYPLPEAQTDRFAMKLLISYPSFTEEKEMLRRMHHPEELPQVVPLLEQQQLIEDQRFVANLYIDEKIVDYILHIVSATRHPEQYQLDFGQAIATGASPRASLVLHQAAKAHAFLSGRGYVTPFDVSQIAADVLRHRLLLSYEAEAAGITPDQLISKILTTIAIP